MTQILSYAAPQVGKPLAPFKINRRDVGSNDVAIKIEFCGICHTDLHQARNEWGGSIFPMVPGHEIVGTVAAVGSSVTRFKVGDKAGIGCMVNSCRKCASCQEGLEQYCTGGVTWTYNSPDTISGGITYGGYAQSIVADQNFVLQLKNNPSGHPLAATAPLLCAGITTYSPLRHWRVGSSDTVGVVGLGGLGHMAVKLAHAMGAEVVMLTTSKAKMEDAKKLGADSAILSTDAQAMQKNAERFSFIIDTAGAPHALDPYISLLKRDGTLCLVGVPSQPHPAPQPHNLILKRRQIAGSVIGGIQETQQMLDFCAQHNITAEIERIPIQEINNAYERMLKSDVRYRFVLDIADSLK